MRYLLFIVEAPDDYGLRNLVDDIVNVLHGPQFSSVELIERSAPQPPYKAKLPADRQVRDSGDNPLEMLKKDEIVYVYGELPDTGNGIRVAITPPGVPVKHIWIKDLIRMT